MKTLYNYINRIPMQQQLIADDDSKISTSRSTSVRDIEQKSKELAKSIQSFSEAQRDQAVSEIKDGIAYINQRIEQVEQTVRTSSEDAKKEVKAEVQKAVDDLKYRRNKLELWVDTVKADSSHSWDEAKRDFQDGLRSFTNAISHFTNQFSD